MTDTATEVFDKLIAYTIANDPDVGKLFAEDAVFELPFAPAGVPTEIRGGEAIRAHLNKSVPASQARWHGATVKAVYAGSEPGVLVAEYLLDAVIAATGEPFQLSSIIVLKVRDGVIASSRTYANPVQTAAAHQYD